MAKFKKEVLPDGTEVVTLVSAEPEKEEAPKKETPEETK